LNSFVRVRNINTFLQKLIPLEAQNTGLENCLRKSAERFTTLATYGLFRGNYEQRNYETRAGGVGK